MVWDSIANEYDKKQWLPRNCVYLYDKVAAVSQYGDEVILNLTNFKSNDLLVSGVYIIYISSYEGRETTRKVGEGAQ